MNIFTLKDPVGYLKISTNRVIFKTNDGSNDFDSAPILTADNFEQFMGIPYQNGLDEDPRANLGINVLDAVYKGRYPTEGFFRLIEVIFPERPYTHFIALPKVFVLVRCGVTGGIVGFHEGELTVMNAGAAAIRLTSITSTSSAPPKFEKAVKAPSSSTASALTPESLPTTTAAPAANISTTTASSPSSVTAGSQPLEDTPSDHLLTIGISNAKSYTLEIINSIQQFANPFLLGGGVPIEQIYGIGFVTTPNGTLDTYQNSSYSELVEAGELSIQLFGEAIRNGTLDLTQTIENKLMSLSSREASYQRGMLYLETRVGLDNTGLVGPKAWNDFLDQGAYKELSDAANMGHVKASCKLGKLYLEGSDVGINEQKAVELLEFAHQAGDLTALGELGIFYYSSTDKKIEQKGVDYLKQVMRRGDSAKAKEIFKKLEDAKKLSDELPLQLADDLLNSFQDIRRFNCEKSFQRTFDALTSNFVECLEYASELNSAQAMFQLAQFYQGTLVIPSTVQNTLSAVANEKGFSISVKECSSYQEISQYGRDANVVKYFTLAHEQGHPTAANELSKYYDEKCSFFDYSSEDYQKARVWEQRAVIVANRRSNTFTLNGVRDSDTD